LGIHPLGHGTANHGDKHPHEQDIDDLIQQTSLTLWREFERYGRSREFLPWALRIGYFEVLRLRKQRSRDRLVFSETLLEMMAEDALPEAAARLESMTIPYLQISPRFYLYDFDAVLASLRKRYQLGARSRVPVLGMWGTNSSYLES
jgi:DNA-directed RNA polymerase specialized sigma24 family protein